jgi:copper chaperone NosL
MPKQRLIPVLFISSLLVIALAACAQGEAVIMPPEIRYGEDVCAECNMIISDPRFAAAYVHEVSPGRYESIAVDDIGDMLIHAAQHPEHTVVRWYVHDYTTEEWLDATSAHFVFSNELNTPMAQGTAAHATLENAQAMAAELGGEVLDWNGLRARHAAGGLMVPASGAGMAIGAGAAVAAGSAPAMMHDRATMHALHQQGVLEEVTLGEAEIDGYSLQLISHGPLHAGYNGVMVHLTGPDGQPVEGARLDYRPLMPTMGHGSPGNENPVPLGNGHYLGTVNFSMSGPWTVTVVARSGGETLGEVTFELQVP